MIDFEYMTICLFGLRMGKKSEKWRIVYGVVSPAMEKMDTPTASGSTQLGGCEHGKLSVRKVIWSGEREAVLELYDDLIDGKSMKASLSKQGVDIRNLEFDMEYAQADIEEPWGTENVMGCQKAYTKKVVMIDPEELFVKDGKKAKDAEKALKTLEGYLQKQTGLPFDERFDHVGNMEVVIVPDRDEAGRPLVELEWVKGKPFHQKISISKLLLEVGDNLTVNVVCTENERTVSDRIETRDIESVEDVKLDFVMDNCPDRIAIKIWRERNGETLVLTDTSRYILKSINVTMNMMGQPMRVTTDWLQEMRKNTPIKMEKDIEEAETIDRADKQQFTIGERMLRRRLRRSFVKENDEFFPKGWDSVNEEQGMLSFLGWFKKKAQGTKSIFLQDPYFEDVAMYFLASADVSSEYTVLTQTQLKTNSDGTEGKVEEWEERKRKSKIVDGIKLNPRMFNPMKLKVMDLPITHNTLHDRYLVFDYGEGRVEAYTLSNSLQGATNKQPLLVTQIGEMAFKKVSSHIAEILGRGDIETIYDYSKNSSICGDDMDKVADKGFFDWLVVQKEKLRKGDVEHILTDILCWKTYEKLSTLGYFLASSADDEAGEILEKLVKGMECDGKWVGVLKGFMLNGHYTKYPIGYINTPFKAYIHADMTPMIGIKYDKIVTAWNTHLMDYVGCEGHTFGVYGQYFVAKLLLKLSVEEFVDVLKQLKPTLEEIKADKTVEPCYMLAEMMMAELMETDFWNKSDRVMKTLLCDEEEWCRGVGALLMLHRAQDDDFRCEDYRSYLNDDDEMVTLCHAAWGMKPAPAHQEVFYEWLKNSFTKKGNVEYFKKRLLGDVLGETHFVEDKVDYMENVVKPLTECGFVDKDILSKALIDGLYEKCVNGKHTVMMAGVLPECLSAIGADLEPFYERARKEKEDLENNLKKMVVKDNDGVFFAAKRCIELRLSLKWLIKKYEKKMCTTIDNVKALLDEIDKLLDAYGLGETKNLYE